MASNATPGTIIETKCGLAERKFQGKVELKLNFLFSLEEDPNPFDWVSDLSGWIIFYLHIFCILNFRRWKNTGLNQYFSFYEIWVKPIKKHRILTIHRHCNEWVWILCKRRLRLLFVAWHINSFFWHNKQKTIQNIIKSFALFWNIIQSHQLWLVGPKSEKENIFLKIINNNCKRVIHRYFW